MKKYIVALVMVALVSVFTAAGFAETGKVTGKHLENDLTCADCHGIDAPTKRAPASACKSCHGDVPGEEREYTESGKKHKVNPHDSHQGEVRCTACHSSHGESKLYCGECHSFTDMIIK